MAASSSLVTNPWGTGWAVYFRMLLLLRIVSTSASSTLSLPPVPGDFRYTKSIGDSRGFAKKPLLGIAFVVFAGLWSSCKCVDYSRAACVALSTRRVKTLRPVWLACVSLLALINVGVLLNYVFV